MFSPTGTVFALSLEEIFGALKQALVEKRALFIKKSINRPDPGSASGIRAAVLAEEF